MYLIEKIYSTLNINYMYYKEVLTLINAKVSFILYGEDYNPDQLSKEIIEEHMNLFKEANINVVTLL